MSETKRQKNPPKSSNNYLKNVYTKSDTCSFFKIVKLFHIFVKRTYKLFQKGIL